jgi:transposase
MIEITFTERDKEALRYERFHHPHPRVQLKMETVWLKSQGLPHQAICRLSGISGNTLRGYLLEFREGGVERLKEVKFRRQKSILDDHRESLEAYFGKHPPATVSHARAVIKDRTGIVRSPTQIRAFLKRMGLAPRKVGAIPAKADVAKQEEFKKNT